MTDVDRCTPSTHFTAARLTLNDARSSFYVAIAALFAAVAETAMGISHHFQAESDILDARTELEYETIEPGDDGHG